MKIDNLSGSKFGALTVTDIYEKRGNKTYWLCSCECGNKKLIRSDCLKSGSSKTCGCMCLTPETTSCVKETKYKGYYVNKLGEIFGKRGQLLKEQIDSSGYKEVILSLKGVRKRVLVHRIILETFSPIDNMENLDVNHINGIKSDNKYENLEWCTRSENIKHSYYNNLQNNVTNQYGNYKVIGKKEILLIKELMITNTPTEIAKKMGYTLKTIKKYIKRIKEGLYEN